jgi:type III secretory pathway component EscV
MDVSVIVNLGILAVAIVAAVIAVFQVVEARKARDDARTARDEAADHERQALEAARAAANASTRSATAQERIAEIAEETANPRPAWLVSKVGTTRWKVTNNTGVNVDFVMISSKPDGYITTEHPQGMPQDVTKGGSLYFDFGGGMDDPSSVNVKITWRGAGKMGDELTVSIP